jgi:hypothetical protein
MFNFAIDAEAGKRSKLATNDCIFVSEVKQKQKAEIGYMAYKGLYVQLRAIYSSTQLTGR